MNLSKLSIKACRAHFWHAVLTMALLAVICIAIPASQSVAQSGSQPLPPEVCSLRDMAYQAGTMDMPAPGTHCYRLRM